MATKFLQTESVSLRQWAKTNQMSYKTAWRMFRDGRLPKDVRAERLPTGTIRLYMPRDKPQLPINGLTSVVIYARVHPREQRDLLEGQVTFCKAFCYSNGWIVSNVVREITPALGSSSRQKLRKLFDNPPTFLVILKQSVISRFDFVLFKECLQQIGCSIVVIDQSEEKETSAGSTLLVDLIDAIAYTCRRHYGQKRGAILIDSLERLVRTNSLK